MKNILGWMDRNFEPLIIAFLFYSMMLLITTQVILRFGFSSGISWSEEASRFIFIWLMYFCFSYTTRNNNHIKISFLLEKLAPKSQKILMIVVDFLFITFSIILLGSSIRIYQTVLEYGDQAVTLNISMNVVYGAGLIGFFLMMIRLIQRIIWKFKQFSNSLDVFINYGAKYTGGDNTIISLKNTEEKGD